MRWKYYNKSNHAESTAHDGVVRAIRTWWEEFSRKADSIDALFRRAEEWDLPEWMNRQLRQIHPELMWEFGPAVSGKGHRLVITPETRSELRPLVQEIIERAPRLAGWEFHAYRIAESVEQSLRLVEARTELDLSNVTVAASVGKDNRMDLVYRWDRVPHNNDQAFDAAFVATESLLGEQALDRWVGVISLVDQQTPAEQGQRFLPLHRLQSTFDALIDSTISQLPAEPYSALTEETEWAVMKLQPEDARDYPERFDLLTCITCNPDLVGATFSEAPFFSERYSRCGETFCYLKIDGADTSTTDFQDRDDMEEAIRNALETQDLGALIGAGTGLRYSYMELALTDVDRGIAAVRRAMSEGNVPRRSWILFHDADLTAEWIGVYDDSPAPPLEKVEL